MSKLDDLLLRASYRPDMKFQIIYNGFGREHVTVVKQTTCSRGLFDHVAIQGGSFLYLPDDTPEPVFYKMLLGLVLDLEAHEAREWFRVDGKIFDDPHR